MRAAPAVLRAIDLRRPWADVDHLWETALDRGMRSPSFRMVAVGETIDRKGLCRFGAVGDRDLDDLLDPNRVLERYDDGATLVLQAIQHVDPAYAQLSTNLALELDQPVQVNAYLSPPAAQGLDLHFDYHDVIVVQLAGSKRWRVWEPLERTQRPMRRGTRIAAPTLEELAAPLVDDTLRPGDCLAVPRGFPHAAETIAEASDHLTIGVMALTWERVVRLALDGGTSSTDLADRLGPEPLDGTDSAGTGAAAAPGALRELEARLSPERLSALVRREVWRRQPRTRVRPRGPVPVALTTPLCVTPGPLLWCRSGTESCELVLELGDRALVLPGEARQLVTAILRRAERFTVDGVRGDLDPESAMAVVGRLVREGVVAVAP